MRKQKEAVWPENFRVSSLNDKSSTQSSETNGATHEFQFNTPKTLLSYPMINGQQTLWTGGVCAPLRGIEVRAKCSDTIVRRWWALEKIIYV